MTGRLWAYVCVLATGCNFGTLRGGSGAPCADVRDCAAGLSCVFGYCAESIGLDSVEQGSPCATQAECGGSGLLCTEGRCIPENCACGVGCLALCAVGEQCIRNRDCASGSCLDGACLASHCTSDTLDADESDIDCGGAIDNGVMCPRCAEGRSCRSTSDCHSGACINGVCGCYSASDCGGSTQCTTYTCDTQLHRCMKTDNDGTPCDFDGDGNVDSETDCLAAASCGGGTCRQGALRRDETQAPRVCRPALTCFNEVRCEQTSDGAVCPDLGGPAGYGAMLTGVCPATECSAGACITDQLSPSFGGCGGAPINEGADCTTCTASNCYGHPTEAGAGCGKLACAGGSCAWATNSGACTGYVNCRERACNFATQACEETATKAPAGTSCSDGLYCNGTDGCDGNGNCAQHATTNACANASYCDGSEPCSEGAGAAICGASTGNPCIDGNYCNGIEVCQDTGTNVGTCSAGAIPCVDSDYCDGTETCASTSATTGTCGDGPDPCGAGLTCVEPDETCCQPNNAPHSSGPYGCCDGGNVVTCTAASTTAWMQNTTICALDVCGNGCCQGTEATSNFCAPDCGCFPYETRVRMADGTQRAIGTLKRGDRVLTFDIERRTYHSRQITDVVINYPSRTGVELVKIDDKLWTTTNHAVWVEGRIVKAEELDEGSGMYHFDRGLVPVSSLSRAIYDHPVFNLEIEGEHNFFVEDILVEALPP